MSEQPWVVSEERWRPIENWPEYSVSSRGRVRSQARTVIRRNGWRLTVRARVLKPCRHNPSDALSVTLSRPGLKERRYITELVRQAGFGDTKAA
jgi:hypothetical protein